jgi:hypothetical protein
MKSLLTLFLFLAASSSIRAQENTIKKFSPLPTSNPFAVNWRLPAKNTRIGEMLSSKEDKEAKNDRFFTPLKETKKPQFEWRETENRQSAGNVIGETDKYSDDEKSGQIEGKEKFHWKPALIQSGILLGIQHSFRMLQKKTRREFVGPFFSDWGASVRNLRGWRDGDNSLTNYVAHPLQGGVTGRIFINNSELALKQEFGKSKRYWNSRLKAMAWSAVWSVQFELGPFSEATLGNVGLRPKPAYSPMAYVDLVVTPVVGTAIVVGEDAIDKYVLKNWIEKKAGGRLTKKIKILRTFLTPTTSFSNLLRGKVPWKRDTR